MRRLAMFAFVLFSLALLPGAASACAVCFDASPEQRVAFLATTALLTAVPLGIVGAVGLWARRRWTDLTQGGEDREE